MTITVRHILCSLKSGGTSIDMGRGRGKGKRGGRGGGRRRFVVSEEDMVHRDAMEAQLRTQKPREDGEDEDEDEDEDEEEEVKDAAVEAIPPQKRLTLAELQEEEARQQKRTGTEGIIKTSNPNASQKGTKMVKIKDMAKLADTPDAGPKLSRREREALEAEQRKEEAINKYLAGETEQAQRDLERLATIRRRREETAKKREEEDKAKEEEKKRDEEKLEEVNADDPEDNPLRILDSRDIKKFNPKQLKEFLKARGLSIQGSKKDLTTRLLEHEAARGGS